METDNAGTVQAVYNNGNPDVSGLWKYRYDSRSNRTDVNDNGSLTYYSSNKLNQYKSVDGTNYTYDNNGNLTYDGTYSYYYDCENRLIEIRNQYGTIGTIKYDCFGRMVRKEFSGPFSCQFCYDGDQIIAEYSTYFNLRAQYYYGQGIDEPICKWVRSSNSKWYYHYDGLGSVVALTDVDGDLVEKYSYDAFGNTTIRDASNTVIPYSSLSINNPFMFTGRYYEPLRGIYYYRARVYKPSIGRFLQPDPIGYKGGLNLYSYCLNNPINYIDPYGLDVWIGERDLFHKNINVGNPEGSYQSWSYRIKGKSIGGMINNLLNPFAKDFRRGVIYRDLKEGKIDKSKYLKTTPEIDNVVSTMIDKQVGQEAGYDLPWGNNCIGFSDDIFEFLEEQYGSKKQCDNDNLQVGYGAGYGFGIP